MFNEVLCQSIKYKAIKKGTRIIQTRKYAKIPDYRGGPARIVGITSFGRDLYVTTSVSGGFIYKVSSTRKVSLWFNVASALKSNGIQLDFSNKIEGGIRSIAFHPNFKNNRLFYISLMESQTKKLSFYRFTSRPKKTPVRTHSVIYEFKVLKNGKPNVKSIRQVIRIAFSNYFHVLKQIIFQGSFLIISHGDGAPDQNGAKGGQGKGDALGKILRINPLKSGNRPYTIPASNPFVKVNILSETYAMGFHNPHNLCLSKRVGDLFVGDTGRDNVEEVNIIKKNQKGSRNYGWPRREGHFNQLQKGGVTAGISKLSGDDSKFKFIYPNAVLPHFAAFGKKFIGVSIATSCPIENGSGLSGLLLYANFPTDGNVYYSFLTQLRKSRTTGAPGKLTWAPTFKADILFDHDGKTQTKAIKLPNLRAVIRREAKLKSQERVDMRFGGGSRGEIYWSSKKSGWIYVITNSIP